MAYKNIETQKAAMRKYYLSHKKEWAIHNKEYAKKNPDKIKEISRRWRKNNPEKTRNARFKYKYGISLEEYKALEKNQSGLCAICKKKNDRNLVVDHIHNSSKAAIRGLLCDKCNCAIGLLMEDLKLIQRVHDYLKPWTRL